MSWGAWAGRPSYPRGARSASTAIRWLRLDEYTGVLTPSTPPTVAIVPVSDDGWADVTVTGSGTVRQSVATQTYYLYDVRDPFGDVADLSTGAYRLLWRMEIDSPSLDADALYHCGVGVFQGTATAPTSADRVIIGGFSPDTGGLRSTALWDAGTTNTTTAITGGVRMDGSWTPYRDPSTPGLGAGILTWSAADGAMVGTTQVPVVSSTVIRSRVWRAIFAIGSDSASTTPVTLRVRFGCVAVTS